MNIVADEGVERQVVEALREAGQQVTYIAEVAPSSSDDEVLARAAAANSLLITRDKDFGSLVYRSGHSHAGVVLVRLPGMAAAQKARLLVRFIEEHGSELVGTFTVVSGTSIRIRRAP